MEHDEHTDHGLATDLKHLAELDSRRRVLRFLGGAGLLPLVGCSSGGAASSTDGGASSANGGSSGSSGTTITDAASPGAGASTTDGGVTSCEPIPDETGGPYPGDGSNGPNALTATGIVRTDIRSSFGASSGTASGVPLTFKLILVDTHAACAPLAGYAVYAWHCDADGQYSLYTAPDQNYLRGVQATDAGGAATFVSIFPGCYSGRWPHIHFEIFRDLESALTASGKIKTSQLALPSAACNAVYATSGYAQSVANFANITLATDMVFSDGAELQIVTIAGNPTDGFSATLVVGIAV